MAVVRIGDRNCGDGAPCLIIAEAGVNHNGDEGLALELVEAAARAGADAVKFQTFSADKLVTKQAQKAAYQKVTTGADETQFDMLRKLELPAEAYARIAAACRDRGILFLSTPFDEENADLLERLYVPAFKLSSGELTNLSLLSHIARKGKPLLLSTGMATLEEVEIAVRTVRSAGCKDIVLFQCVSNYPAAPEDVNLRAMATMASAFGVPVGYSDHVTGLEISYAAVAMGAAAIEKHFTLDRSLPGPDQSSSMEPGELAELVRGIRRIESAFGDGVKRPSASEADTIRAARRSLVAARDLPAGTVLQASDIELRRPGTGLAPSARESICGKRLKVSLKAGELFSLDMLS